MATNRRRAGFSLLELMLVLAIIGVLAAVAAWNIVGVSGRANKKATIASMGKIKDALVNYNLDNPGTYPATLMVLGTAKYLDATKLTDAWKREFYYLPTGNQERPFDLISSGEDGQMGTEDDINVWTMNR